MKKLFLASMIAGVIFFSACNGNSTSSTTNTDSTNNSMNSNDTNANKMNSTDTNTNRMSSDSNHNMSNANATVDKDAVDFAQEAAEGGMMEVQLGQIAQKNSSTKSIQDFGKMMVDDHSALNDKLKDLASKKNVSLPSTLTNDQQQKVDKLSKETGKDFDKDYVSMMIDDHKKDIDKFKKAGKNIKDADFKDFVIKALPTLQKHLDAIEAIHKKM
jgi:putative membrane protein